MYAKLKDRFRKTLNIIKTKKTTLSVFFIWSLTIAFVVIKSYWLLYVQNPVLIEKRIWAFSPLGYSVWLPRLFIEDYIIIIIVSFAAGVFLEDLSDIFYSWFASNILSFVCSTLYIFFYVWIFVGVGDYFSSLGIANELIPWVFLYVMINILWMYLPLVICFTLLASFVGALLGSRFFPLRDI